MSLDDREPPALNRAAWEDAVLTPARARTPERASTFLTAAGRRVDVVYTSEDVHGLERPAASAIFPLLRDGEPAGGECPAWTLLADAGQGTLEDTNLRLRRLTAEGATGFHVAFPGSLFQGSQGASAETFDSEAEHVSRGRTMADMASLCGGLPLSELFVSIDGDLIDLALLLAAAESGGDWRRLSGAVQYDPLGAQIRGTGEGYPLRHALRLTGDAMRFCQRRGLRWAPVTAYGPGLRAAGATARFELAWTIASALEYVNAGIQDGIDGVHLASHVSCVFGVEGDFFEEIARLRAARLVWTCLVRERFGDEGAGRAMRIQAQAMNTLGHSGSSAEQADVAVMSTYQSLAAILGGASAMQRDASERWSIEDAILALRAQQILVAESGVMQGRDPFGGSWWLERSTEDFANQALADIEDIDSQGGMAAAVASGIPQRQLEGGMSRQRRAAAVEVSSSDREGGAVQAPTAPAANARRPRVDTPRAQPVSTVERALESLENAAAGTGNVMDALVDCARGGATAVEMSRTLRRMWEGR